MSLRYLMIAISLCLPAISRADIQEGWVGFVGAVSEGTCALAEPEHSAPSGNTPEGESAGTRPPVPVTLHFKSCAEKLFSGMSVSLHDASEENAAPRFMYSGGKDIARGEPVEPAAFIRKNNHETSLKLLFSHHAGEGKAQPGAVVHLRYD